MLFRRYRSAVAALMIILFLAEIAVRVAGLSDFPLYDADNVIGYIPKPSQFGKYLRKNDWQFNSQSMGAVEFVPSDAVDILLIGDSLVQGGNSYRQEDRLGPQLGKVTNQTVWPISAGSWALRNELKYLSLHPDIVERSDRLIFVVNSGDFGQASSWSCEKTHPRVYSKWATLYVFRRYVWDWEKCSESPKELVVPNGDWGSELGSLFSSLHARGKSMTFVLYPYKDEISGKKTLGELESHASEIMRESGKAGFSTVIVSVGRDPRWNHGFYRDGIHPSFEGTRVLAEIISAPDENTKLPR
jgi:hypothetical protein